MPRKSNRYDYSFDPPTDKAQDLSRKWLILAITSLAIAGIYSILLVAARTPVIQTMLPYDNFFHTALVVHVDLSVLVWLLSFTCLLWIYTTNGNKIYNCRAAFFIAATGMVLMAIAPFMGDGKPLLNNYIPILQNLPFIFGLSLFLAGIIVQLIFSLGAFIQTLRTFSSEKNTTTNVTSSPHTATLLSIAITALLVLLSLVIFFDAHTALHNVNGLDATEYYELLFWGGGHLLQVVYTHIMLIAWLWLASIVSLKSLPDIRTSFTILMVNLCIAIVLVFYAKTLDITSIEYIDLFTQHMRWIGGIASIIIGIWIFRALIIDRYDKTRQHEYNALTCSMILFFIGGLLGFAIHGANVVVPAHYHGSIVGVTLACMGLTYHFLPKLGYGEIRGKMPQWQPILYGGGQLLHIIGLAWSGGYGALRKTPGAIDSFAGQMGMGLMGLGGLLSVIGGLLFVIIAYKSILRVKY